MEYLNAFTTTVSVNGNLNLENKPKTAVCMRYV